jgi:hypothetical protein
MMTLEHLKTIVLNSESKDEMYKCEIELTEIVSSLYKTLPLLDLGQERIETKSKLSLANSLLTVCRERKEEVGNLANRINYNFRTAAKLMLSKETYEKIYSQACVPRKETKEMKKELKSNRADI